MVFPWFSHGVPMMFFRTSARLKAHLDQTWPFKTAQKQVGRVAKNILQHAWFDFIKGIIGIYICIYLCIIIYIY